MRRRAMVFAALLAGPIAAVAGEPALPEWNGTERKDLEAAGWIAGGLLLADDAAVESAPEPSPPLDVEQPTAEEIAEDATPSPVIPEKFLPAYFAERPQSYLVDPQGLLGPADFRDRLAFLNYHASDSSIDLFVYVFGADQEIPGEVREEEMIERFFSEGRQAVVVYYYLGAPQRSVVYLSPSLTDDVSAAEQRRALASSITQAFEKVNPAEQIEAFLVQMSIRIYWMERMLAGPSFSGEILPFSVSAVKAPAADAKLEWIRERAGAYGFPTAIGAGGILTTLLAGACLRRRARYQFPDFDVEPRLGGAHAAGVGAVISFANAAVPPASQRDQVPDYLRRA